MVTIAPTMLQDLLEKDDPLSKHVKLQSFRALINERGEIAVTGIDTRTNTMHAYILQPDDHFDREDVDHDE
jgi:hypothetical protein